jgi:hypothetical protein
MPRSRPHPRALAGPEENLEERFDEARTSPTPVVKRGSWVVVPIPVSNPTVGTGLELAVLYLHAKVEGDESPAATSGAAAMATDGGARLVGGFHDSSLYDDHLRISAFAGVGEFHLKYYGVADDPVLSGNPLPYKVEGTLAQLRGEVRIPGTEHWFGGATYQYFDATFTADTSEIVPGFTDTPHHFRSAAFGPHITFDSRDSNYYPRSGQRFRAGWLNYGPRWGGDFSFDKIDVFYNHYLPFGRTSVLGLRARMQNAGESTPFLFLPTLDMRGFSRDRYRDNRTVSLTAEWRQMLFPRWGSAAYAASGRYAARAGAQGQPHDHDCRRRHSLAGHGRSRLERRPRLRGQHRRPRRLHPGRRTLLTNRSTSGRWRRPSGH